MLKKHLVMKVLLINPPYAIFTGYVSRYFPVGLGYIGSTLKEIGFNQFVSMDYEEFVGIAEYLMKEFNKHNTHWTKMFRRGWARRKAYLSDPGLLAGDLRKAVRWALERW